jgi:YhcH/YjgK/YiaL family protein
MIRDELADAGRYTGLHPLLAEGLRAAGGRDWSRENDGRIPLGHDAVWAQVQRYQTRAAAGGAGRWEAHRACADIQLLAAGSELIGFAPAGPLVEAVPYDAAKDVEFFRGTGECMTLRAGVFAVFFPGEPHLPCLADGEPAGVIKVVIKVRLAG